MLSVSGVSQLLAAMEQKGSSSTDAAQMADCCFPVFFTASVEPKEQPQVAKTTEAWVQERGQSEKVAAGHADRCEVTGLQKIRIGPERHRYTYTRVAANLFKCRRGSDGCETGQKLWLRRSFSGRWIAHDGPDQDIAPPMAQSIFLAMRMYYWMVGTRGAWTSGMDVSHPS